jgi:hypothetical protein
MQYGKHLSVAKDQQYRCHDFEPACCIRITKFCQPTDPFRAYTRRFDRHSDLSLANLICIFLISNLEHTNSGHIVHICAFRPTTSFPLYNQSGRHVPRDKCTNARRSPSCTGGKTTEYVTRTECHENTGKLKQKVQTSRAYNEPTTMRCVSAAGEVSVGLQLTNN